jgi:hypothetical protein
MAKWKIAWKRSLCNKFWTRKIWRMERRKKDKMDRKR